MPEQVRSSVPAMVDVSFEDDIDLKKRTDLQYGVATPGTMATTASPMSLSSPFGLFASFAASSQQALFSDNDDNNNGEQKVSDDKDLYPITCLGITSPTYLQDDDDESVTSTRIGIERSDYVIPEGDLPISPIENFFSKKKKKPVVSKEYDSDEDDALWQLNLSRPQEPLDLDMRYPSSRLDTVPEDDVDRVLHKQTAEGHYLVNSRPMDKPIDDIKYTLNKGKRGMDRSMRRASDSRITAPKTRPNVVRANSSPVSPKVTDGASFKVFLLLIQPQSKIFEIIQLFYSPSHTLVSDILDLIPANATEPALGMQNYSGVCRPKDGRPIDLEMMASASNGSSDCARIVRGEILVAIPDGFSGPLCAKIAEPLLSNPKVTRLLNRSDPLAPTLKKKKSTHRSSRRYKAIAVETGTPMKAPHNLYEGSVGDKEDRVHDKESGLLRKALGGSEEDVTGNTASDAAHFVPTRDMWQTSMSFRSDSSCSSVGSNNSTGCEFFSPPRSLSFARQANLRMSSEKQLSIPEHPSESSVQEEVELPPDLVRLSDDASPSSAAASLSNVSNTHIDLTALEAKLQSNDVNGAIDAFSKMLSTFGDNDAVVKQLHAVLQQQQQNGATPSN